ncbi:MAG: recombination-associated protein RdgC, partial [Deltaproteobacteria bacterium]|nr:recombination-associated protein RdgC [Deltaproteobacteria bacterium]
MSLLKGSVNLTRYHIADEYPDLLDEILTARIRANAFKDIEATADEESVGWVGILDWFDTEFQTHHLVFGDTIGLAVRMDQRQVSPSMVNRYLSLAEAGIKKKSGNVPSVKDRRGLKDRIRYDLLARVPVTTKVTEICWLKDRKEIWLGATGVKERERFEELWRKTFGLGLVMKVPF